MIAPFNPISIMKENVKQALYEFIKAVLLALVGFISAVLVTSCGSTTRALIRNHAESTSTTVTITTNNPTNWQVNPSVDTSINPR